jgi:hypothetical protein
MIADAKEWMTMMKTTTITLAALVALSSCLTAAHGAHHGKKKVRHSVARSMKTPTPPNMPSRVDRSNCQSIPGMSSDNEFGVDNDFNVYRQKVPCN